MSELLVKKRENGKWQYLFEIPSQNGKRKRITKSGFDTKALATKEGTRVKAMYDNGGIVPKTKKTSMNDMFDKFLVEVKKTLKPTTYDTYKVRIRVHLKPMLGAYDFNTVTRAIIQNKLDNYDTGKYTMNSLVTILKSFYKWAVKRGYCENNIMRDIIKPKIATSEPKRYLIPRETFDTIVAAYPEFKIPLYLMYFTGMRKGEVIGLRWSDIDLDNSVIHLRKAISYSSGNNVLSTPKTDNAKRDIFIGDTLKKALEVAKNTPKGYIGYYLDDDIVKETIDGDKLGFVNVFPTGKLIDRNKLANLSANINNRITTEFNYHSLRHTHISNLLMNGADIKAVQLRVGHADIATTLNIYAKINEKKMRETAQLSEL